MARKRSEQPASHTTSVGKPASGSAAKISTLESTARPKATPRITPCWRNTTPTENERPLVAVTNQRTRPMTSSWSSTSPPTFQLGGFRSTPTMMFGPNGLTIFATCSTSVMAPSPPMSPAQGSWKRCVTFSAPKNWGRMVGPIAAGWSTSWCATRSPSSSTEFRGNPRNYAMCVSRSSSNLD